MKSRAIQSVHVIAMVGHHDINQHDLCGDMQGRRGSGLREHIRRP